MNGFVVDMDTEGSRAQGGSDPYLRDLTFVDYAGIDDRIVQYAAGFADQDGCFKVQKAGANYSVQFTMAQAAKGIEALHFVHANFGGSINLQLHGDEKNQRAYDYSLNGEHALEFVRTIEPFLLLKRREARCLLEFPFCHLHIIPIVATNTATGEERRFDTLKECARNLGRVAFHFKDKEEVINYRDWAIRKALTRQQVADIRERRQEIFAVARDLKRMPHDAIPGYTPSDPYFAGFFDGDGMMDTHGKSGQVHKVSQKYPEICNLFKRTFGGTVRYSKSEYWTWQIYTGADDFLHRVAPFIVGKRQQVDLILNMEPGGAQRVHADLRLLKGKGTAMATPLIDRYNSGDGQRFTAVKDLPKGVFRNKVGTYDAQLQHDKVVYVLGRFSDPHETHELYMKVKREITAAKAVGRPFDLSQYHRRPSLRS